MIRRQPKCAANGVDVAISVRGTCLADRHSHFPPYRAMPGENERFNFPKGWSATATAATPSGVLWAEIP